MLKIVEEGVKSVSFSQKDIALIVANLFRKESDGSPIDFYFNKQVGLQKEGMKSDISVKFDQLKTQIEEGGGCLWETPHGSYCIEIAFINEGNNTIQPKDSSHLFSTDFIVDCIKNRELLNLEDYRIGKFNSDVFININDVMKGFKKWDVVDTERKLGTKLPDFGSFTVSESSEMRCKPASKRNRVEYSMEEDYLILTYLLKTNSYDKVGGNKIWKDLQMELPSRSCQSLQNHFRRHILPNINKYKNLTSTERSLFIHTGKTCYFKNTINLPISARPFPVDPPYPSEATTNNCPNQNCTEEQRSPNLSQEIHHSCHLQHNMDELPSRNISTPVDETPKQSSSSAIHNQLEPEDDRRLLNYISINEKYSEIHGKSLWIDIKKQVFSDLECEWQSIKRRFFEVILPNLDSEKYELDSHTLLHFRKYCRASPSKELDGSSEHNTDSSVETLRTCEEVDSVPSVKYNQRSSMGGQRFYSIEEDNLIIEYISKTARYSEVRGKSLWVDIQDKILQAHSRTWESAKTRFLKSIVKNLSKYQVDEETSRKFKAGLTAKRNRGGRSLATTSPGQTPLRTSASITVPCYNSTSTKASVKHPAFLLQNDDLLAARRKRKLYRPPQVPLPIIYSPDTSSNYSKYFPVRRPESGDQDPACFAPAPDASAHVSNNLPSATLRDINLAKTLRNCSVMLTRLPDNEVSKYYD